MYTPWGWPTKGRNMSELQCFTCKNFKIWHSPFVGIFSNFNIIHLDLRISFNIINSKFAFFKSLNIEAQFCINMFLYFLHLIPDIRITSSTYNFYTVTDRINVECGWQQSSKNFVFYYFSLLRLAILFLQYPAHVLKGEITIVTVAISSTYKAS